MAVQAGREMHAPLAHAVDVLDRARLAEQARKSCEPDKAQPTPGTVAGLSAAARICSGLFVRLIRVAGIAASGAALTHLARLSLVVLAVARLILTALAGLTVPGLAALGRLPGLTIALALLAVTSLTSLTLPGLAVSTLTVGTLAGAGRLALARSALPRAGALPGPSGALAARTGTAALATTRLRKSVRREQSNREYRNKNRE